MRIAILSFYSGNINRGVETWTTEISSRLTNKGHSVLVLQTGEQKEKVNYMVKTLKVKIFWKLRVGETWFNQVLVSPYWFSIELEHTVRCLIPLLKFRPDIVIPCNGGVQTFLIRLYCWVFGWKMAVVGHAGIGAPDKWNLLCRPDVFISPSLRGKIWAENLIYSKGIKIVNIPHGVDLNKFSPNIKNVNIKLQKPIILCVSSFDPFKRIELAVKAVSGLQKGSLLIIGGDRDQGKIDNLAHIMLGSRRYLKIKATPNEMPSYYSSCDIFTLPSDIFEAFGIVYLEALASNLPIVATDDDLRKEIIDGAGILVNPENINSYSDALRKALDTNWHDKPRKQAEKFSWDKVIEMYEVLFEKILNS